MMKGLFAGVIGLGAVGVTALQLSAQSSTSPAGSAATPSVDAGAAARSTVAATDAGTTAPSLPPPSVRTGSRTDGGALFIGDPPGRLTASADGGAVDGGDAGAADGGRTSGSDGGSQGSVSPDEVQRLRERVAALEQELARTHAAAAAQKQQVDQLDQLNQQVASLRQQLAEEQSRRQTEENAAQQSRAQQQQAVSALSAAQQQLAAGDSRVLETLESASGSLPEPAQRAIETARSSVQSGDLSAARYWLSVAISQTQQAQIKR
jgi:hypothetical protein